MDLVCVGEAAAADGEGAGGKVAKAVGGGGTR